MTTILYDLPSKGRCAAWSLNPWKARMSLNFKACPYETEWVEYPDVAPLCKSLGLAPNEAGNTPYTIPTIRFPDSAVFMDSRKIAAEIEKRHPSPSMHLDDEILPKVEGLIANMILTMAPVVMPQIPGALLNPPSAQYFEETREKRFGMSLAQLEKEKGGDQAWEKAKGPITEMAGLLKQKGGPFFLGKIPSYADIVLVTLLHFVKRVNEQDFERLVSHDPAFMEVYNACKPWLERDT